MQANGTNSVLQILEFYVFNSKFGNDSDNEIGKILYSYPTNIHQDRQLKQIGLCEAIVKFAQTFNAAQPCESLHTQKCRHIYLQPEPGFWFIMVLAVPSVQKLDETGHPSGSVEYHEDEIQDSVFLAILDKLYRKFLLLNDKLAVIAEGDEEEGEGGVTELRRRLKKCLDSWLQRIDAHHAGITDIFRGVQFLPLDRDTFLRIQGFINNFLVTWPLVKYVVLMQRDKLVWCGIDQNHIQLLYDYLVSDLLSQHFLTGADKQATYGVILKKESHVNLHNSFAGNEEELRRGSVDSPAEDNASFVTASSTATLNGSSGVRERYHLVIYKAEQTYLTFLIPDSTPFDPSYIAKAEAFLNLNFTPIARDLAAKGQQLGMKQSTPHGGGGDAAAPAHKYIYYNSLNFAEKLCPGYQVDLEAYKVLADLKRDLSRSNENGEIIMKMVSDTWIVAKVSNKREFYAIFNQKNSNVLEIDEEMRKLTESHLQNIFFQE